MELCMDVARADWATPGGTEGANSFQEHTVFPNRDMRLPYQDLLYAKGSFYDMGKGGNDVRVVGCGRSLSYPVKPGWNKAWVLNNVKELPDGKQEVELLLHFFKVHAADADANMHRREVFVMSSVPPAKGAPATEGGERAEDDDAENAKRKAIGFEFRMMDNFPSTQMIQILRIVSLLAASAVHCEARDVGSTDAAIALFDAERALHDASWNAALVNVSRKGSHAPLPPAYISKLYRVVFGSDDPLDGQEDVRSDRDGRRRAYPALLRMCEDLFSEHGNHEVVQNMHEKTYVVPPKPVNYNLLFWKEAFRTLVAQGHDGKTGRRGAPAVTDSYIRAFLQDKKRSGDPDWRGDLSYLHALPAPEP